MTEPPIADDPPAEPNSCSARHSGSATCGTCGRWRLPLLLAVVLAAIMALNGRGIRVGEKVQQSAGVEPAAAETSGKTVSLEIDFGDRGQRRVHSVSWREGMTVADVLAAAGRGEQPAPLEYVVQGSGASAYLAEIAGVANAGAGGPNWTYTVNDQRADRGLAVYELEPGDRVLWSFAPSE